MEREWQIELEDGCTWCISWFQDAAGFFAQAFDFSDEDDDSASGPRLPCTCSGPDIGVFDTLETIEVAMGRPIPPNILAELLDEQRTNPISQADKDSWGVSWAVEIERTDLDGTIWSSFAPTWADDPLDPRWFDLYD